MNVGIYLTAGDASGYVLAADLVRSIRRAMPGVPVVHLTDLTSPEMTGSDSVARMATRPMSLHRSALFASVGGGEWLFLDTDVVVQRDVSHVFSHGFDIAVTDRQWTTEPGGGYRAGGQPGFISQYPYNAGVVFSRSPQFWRDVYQRLVDLPQYQESWFGDQAILCELALSLGLFHPEKLHVLPGQFYNFPPYGPNDPETAGASIVHYKGARKAWRLKQVAA